VAVERMCGASKISRTALELPESSVRDGGCQQKAEKPGSHAYPGSEVVQLRVQVPAEGQHAVLISCQVALPEHTAAKGDVRAIAERRFEKAYLTAHGPASSR
jgi:hypothetical protein